MTYEDVFDRKPARKQEDHLQDARTWTTSPRSASHHGGALPLVLPELIAKE
jgi:hypothetical protein